MLENLKVIPYTSLLPIHYLTAKHQLCPESPLLRFSAPHRTLSSSMDRCMWPCLWGSKCMDDVDRWHIGQKARKDFSNVVRWAGTTSGITAFSKTFASGSQTLFLALFR